MRVEILGLTVGEAAEVCQRRGEGCRARSQAPQPPSEQNKCFAELSSGSLEQVQGVGVTVGEAVEGRQCRGEGCRARGVHWKASRDAAGTQSGTLRFQPNKTLNPKPSPLDPKPKTPPEVVPGDLAESGTPFLIINGVPRFLTSEVPL